MHYSSKRSWVPVLRNVDAVKDMNWPKYGVHELIAGIRKTVMEKQSSVRGCVGLLAILYIDKFSPIGERVTPSEKRSIPRVLDWTQKNVNMRVSKLKGLDMYIGQEVDIVDAVVYVDDAVMTALHKRLDGIAMVLNELKKDIVA
ncbi:hypothetical protein M9H77_02026 [Catharanthus roseus]|uniref:Uncharacterized protein n=1 Tax=Catharanthus roseus TaxID=4058 RepID=A0ACC0C7C4_CATRO|nr:hypothetical protein M9H77_02026 [Catharanthus roseus]